MPAPGPAARAPVHPPMASWPRLTGTAAPVAEWRDIPGCPGYQASDAGEIRSVNRRLGDGRFSGGKVLAQGTDRKGYRTVTIRRDGASTTKRVHVLVALAFLGRRPPGQEILHRNDDKSRNGVTDLRYGTPRRNVLERVRRERRTKSKKERKPVTDRAGSVTPAWDTPLASGDAH